MFDIGASELLLIIIVAVVVIGPKDMPLALRTAGRWIGKFRRMSSQFRAGLDAMVREAEMQEMEQKWREQNEKVMREHPNGGPAEMEPTGALPPPRPATEPEGASAESKAPPPPPPPSPAPAAQTSLPLDQSEAER
ncbi:twin arginine-targeting protein translocase TatB [Altererythrobacter sp. B11]|uniref:Sec-independent protein translocase protein TatB n=1 Tax=Altererythrobacter sp. B11 TaxID=2060312 RepID=UPI000DC6F1E8|nr:Sec-independent protein translocase protein TatB [Altererythrobacter sp. B11]BBC74153.1 twin arginine-targeting protein translocase TatB [Altererythrobacter sp. B11]